MFNINLRRLVYASLLPKSQMGRGVNFIAEEVNPGTLDLESARKLYSSYLGTFALKGVINKNPVPLVLYKYWTGSWESSCYVQGADPCTEGLAECEEWLEKEPIPLRYVAPHNSTIDSHSTRDFRSSGGPQVFSIKGITYWRSTSRSSRFRRRVVYVGDAVTYYFSQALVQGQVGPDLWRNVWALKSTSESLFYKAAGAGFTDLITSALVRTACAEYASISILGDSPSIGETSETRMRKSVESNSNPSWGSGWVTVD